MCPGDWPFPGPSPPVTRFSLCPAQHDGQPYCHKPCYGILFGPKGECLQAHGVGSRSGGTHPTRAAALDAHAIAQRGHLPGACHLPARVLTLLHLPPPPCRSQHRSCGKLHLRQRPRGEEPALDGGVPLPARPLCAPVLTSCSQPEQTLTRLATELCSLCCLYSGQDGPALQIIYHSL